MNETEKLEEKLNEIGGTLLGISLGPEATHEKVARQIRLAIEDLENGDCTPIDLGQ